MTSLTDLETSPATPAGARLTPTRPLYWSVRREVWESRSIYIAPIVAGAVVLFGFLLGTHRMHITGLDPAQRARAALIPYDIAALAIMLTGFIVAVFYCLGALHNERRDRSILFWKSLPVSDLTTVMAKVIVPMIVVPLAVFVVVVATQLVMLLIATAIQLPNGADAMGLVWARWPLIRMSLVLIYGLVTITLWYAPIYGWLLLVSVWAKRAPFLWAVLPPLAISLVEAIAFGTSHFASLVHDRFFGSFDLAFASADQHNAMIDLSQIDAARFFSSLGLWAGLGVAAALVAAAVWLRRSREPS